MGKQTKISYQFCQVLNVTDNPCSKWTSYIKQITADVGHNDIWLNQNSINSFGIKFYVKQVLTDQFLYPATQKVAGYYVIPSKL